MGTTTEERKPSLPTPVHRAWRLISLPMIPVGLLIWLAGILFDGYWLVVGGMLLAALGAYKVTDR